YFFIWKSLKRSYAEGVRVRSLKEKPLERECVFVRAASQTEGQEKALRFNYNTRVGKSPNLCKS
ncbi:MAG: hypothetical protein ACYT04_75610, partial [Nostoc sp.]